LMTLPGFPFFFTAASLPIILYERGFIFIPAEYEDITCKSPHASIAVSLKMAVVL
jgi:hypothetical protein